MPKPPAKRQPSPAQVSVPRILLAVFCILFIAAGMLARWLPFLDQGSSGFASGTFLKVGVVLLVAWLAAPQLERFGWQRLRGTALVGLIVVIALFAIRPRIGAIAGALFVGGSLVFGVVSWLRKLTRPPV